MSDAATGPTDAPRYRVAVLPGDGIGPEVTEAACSVVEAAGQRFGFEVTWQRLVVGGAAIDAHGVAMRPEDLLSCEDSDAVLLGAVGGPRWDDPRASVRPEQSLFMLRGGLGLYANLRPVRPLTALMDASPLRRELVADVDMLIVRELTGGIYFGERREATGPPGKREAVDTVPYGEHEIRRVVRLAFELARGRRRLVTSVDKANVLATSRLWRMIATEEAEASVGIRLEHRLVDSCAMSLVTRPADFDVVVTENLFGDILSDEASVLVGSLGMLPSASLGERRTRYGTFGLYEPVHGSAPDIAGQDVANPLGAILSAAMMLRWSFGREDAATAIERAVEAVLDAGYRTADLTDVRRGHDLAETRLGTAGMVTRVIDAVTASTSGRALETVR